MPASATIREHKIISDATERDTYEQRRCYSGAI
jgi:hypothetical protein